MLDVVLPKSEYSINFNSNTIRLPLGLINSVQLSHNQAERLKVLEDYDFWFVKERLVKKQLIREELIEDAIFEFKRYIALIVLGNRNLSMLNSEIDEVWHTFILFTRKYAKFCHSVLGEFIHHAPVTSRMPQATNGPQRFLALYQDYFGELNHKWYKHHFAKNSNDCDDTDCDDTDCMDSCFDTPNCVDINDNFPAMSHAVSV